MSGCLLPILFPAEVMDYSLPLSMAAITRGLRLPWMTATTQRGFSSGA